MPSSTFGLLAPLASYQATQSIPNAARLTVAHSKAILPLIGVLAFEITVVYALDRGWRFRYAGTTIEPIAQQPALGLTVVQKVSTLQLTSSQQNFSAPLLPENRALQCSLNGSVSGGTVISVRSQVLYAIVNTPS